MSDESLKSLYPFLHDAKKDQDSEHTALLESVRQKARESVEVKQDFFADNAGKLIDMSRTLAECFSHDGKLMTMGNGGSSCDAAHVAVEFLHPVTAGRPALPALNLNNDNAFISAVANDVGFEHVFTRQLLAQGKAGDCLLGFSTSGNSENLLAAFHKAKRMGIHCIGFTGDSGGEMYHSDLLDHCLRVESDSIHRIQEVHVACYHILWDITHTLLADARGPLGQSSHPDNENKI